MLSAYRGVASDIFSARWLGQRVRLDYESKSLPQRVVLLNGSDKKWLGLSVWGQGSGPTTWWNLGAVWDDLAFSA